MPTNTTITHISHVINYIEDNINRKLTLDDIANNSYLSKYHLHRIFKSSTSQSLMDYVRGRKLTHSIYFLLNTDLKLIDIANEYGFEYEQSYIRSFNRLFRISPNQFRKEKSPLIIVDKINIEYFYPIGEKDFIIKPMILIKPSFSVVGIKRQFYLNDNEFFYKMTESAKDFFDNHKNKVNNARFPDTYIGISIYVDRNAEYRYYMPGTEVSQAENIPPGMISYTVPCQKYAVFKYIGFHHPMETSLEKTFGIFEYIFDKWLGNSGYELSGVCDFESIDMTAARNDYCEMDIYIPIKAGTSHSGLSRLLSSAKQHLVNSNNLSV